jgi:branched-chain amino acid transport system substrate-binding protein
MNKITKIIISFVVLVIIVLLVISSSKQAASNSIKIGVVSFPTGPAAAFAKISLNGISLAVDDINKSGGVKGRNIEVVIEDYAYDKKRAVPAYEKLKAQGIKFFFLDGSSAAAAVGPVIRADGNLSVVPSAAIPSYKDGNPLTCRLALTADSYGPAMAEFIAKKFSKPRVAFLMPNNDYGQGIQDKTIERLKALGGTIVDQEKFDQTASDFRTQITKLKGLEKDYDVLVTTNIYNTVEPMFKQIHDLGLTKPIVSENWTTMNPQFKNRDLEEGVLYADYAYTSDPAENENPNVSAFKSAYKERHGEYPSPHAANSYDSIQLLAKGLANANDQTPASVSDYFINKLGTYAGVSGPFAFNSDCEVDRGITMRIVKNGMGVVEEVK